MDITLGSTPESKLIGSVSRSISRLRSRFEISLPRQLLGNCYGPIVIGVLPVTLLMEGSCDGVVPG